MITWSLTTLSAGGPTTIAGQARDEHAARRNVAAAAHTTAGRADAHSRPRYLLHVGGELIALIDTGNDIAGQPDHAEAKRLIELIPTSTAHTSPSAAVAHR